MVATRLPARPSPICLLVSIRTPAWISLPKGSVILRVGRRSPAHRLGLRRGDVIVSIADRALEHVADLNDTLYRLPEVWRLEIDRGGRRLGVTIGR